MDTSRNHFIPAEFARTQEYLRVLHAKDGISADEWAAMPAWAQADRFHQWKSSNKIITDFGLTLNRFLELIRPVSIHDIMNAEFIVTSFEVLGFPDENSSGARASQR